jgi:small-conductance mechanosensitive channel
MASAFSRDGVIGDAALKRRGQSSAVLNLDALNPSSVRMMASRFRAQAGDDVSDERIERSLFSIKFCVQNWKKRRRTLKQAVREEVARRRQQNGASLINSEFTPQMHMMRELSRQTEDSVERALNHMAQNRRHGMLRAQAGAVQRLLYALDAVRQRIELRTGESKRS